jgi:hypothetical protein
MSGDPIGGDTSDPQSLNRYAYVGNNPINLVDPSGLVSSGVGPQPIPGVPDALADCTLFGFSEPSFDASISWSDSGFGLSPSLGGFGCSTELGRDWRDFHSNPLHAGSGGGGGGGSAPAQPPQSSQPPGSTPAPSSPPQTSNCAGSHPVLVPGFPVNTFTATFDANGVLSGVSVNSGKSPGSMSVSGLQLSFAPNTAVGIQWANGGTLPGSFVLGSSHPIKVSAGLFTSASISSITFNGCFSAKGGARFLGIPLGSGLIDNFLNSNSKLVLKATDLANWLKSHPIANCSELGGT